MWLCKVRLLFEAIFPNGLSRVLLRELQAFGALIPFLSYKEAQVAIMYVLSRYVNLAFGIIIPLRAEAIF
jgi:hypothetical protein